MEIESNGALFQFGVVPEITPESIVNVLPGQRVRIRMRQDEWVMAFVRDKGTITEYPVLRARGRPGTFVIAWGLAQSANVTIKPEPRVRKCRHNGCATPYADEPCAYPMCLHGAAESGDA